MRYSINEFFINYMFIAIMIIFVIDIIMAKLMENVAVMKGYGKKMNIFAICFFLTIFGYFYVFILPDKIIQSQNQEIIDLLKQRKN